MLTEQEARRIADVFLKTADLPNIGERIRRARAEVPHATDDDIKQALKTHLELARLAKIDAGIELEEIERELDRWADDGG
jgi:hypothetical protein